MRTLPLDGHELVGLDIKASPFTHRVGSITDRDFVRRAMAGIDVVLHTAALHKPHIATHAYQDFVDTNVTGTLNLLEAARGPFVYTSTTSVFGRALTPSQGDPAAWITDDVTPVPKNIYGITKLAAEHLCELFHRRHGLPCVILRTSRFFPEEDDRKEIREAYSDANAKVNEFLYRRTDVEDIVTAHQAAFARAESIGFGRYVVSATTPFTVHDLAELHRDAPAVVRRHVPAYEDVYRKRGWSMFPTIDRVYINDSAREALEWNPRRDFASIVEGLRTGQDHRSPLALTVGSKGYHDGVFAEGPYPV